MIKSIYAMKNLKRSSLFPIRISFTFPMAVVCFPLPVKAPVILSGHFYRLMEDGYCLITSIMYFLWIIRITP